MFLCSSCVVLSRLLSSCIVYVCPHAASFLLPVSSDSTSLFVTLPLALFFAAALNLCFVLCFVPRALFFLLACVSSVPRVVRIIVCLVLLFAV